MTSTMTESEPAVARTLPPVEQPAPEAPLAVAQTEAEQTVARRHEQAAIKAHAEAEIRTRAEAERVHFALD